MAAKQKAFRSAEYLKWVKSLPCCMCQCSTVDAHHIIGIGHLGGMGTTAPDSFTMPLCRYHHSRVHAEPELWPEQWEWVARTQARAQAEGVLV